MNRNAWIVLGFLASLGLGPSAQAGGQLFDNVAGGLSGMGCGGSGCWSNYLRVQEITGDDSLDLVVPNMGGFFSLPGNAQDLEIFANNGSGMLNGISAAAVGGFTGRNRQVAIGDVDGDGDNDMYVPDGAGNPDALFINDGTGVFTDEIATRLPGAASNAGAVRFGDLDGDGDLDLVIADGYGSSGNPETLHFYENDGTGVFSEIVGAAPGNAAGTDIDDIDIADFDRDFDLDVFINPHSGNPSLWLNDGTGMFSSSPVPAVGGGSQFHYNPGVCDVDNDGDLDILIDNTGGGYTEQLLLNDGAGGFTDASGQITGNSGADDNGVMCADIDNDGDFDAVVINVGGASSNLRLFDNDGAGNFTAVPGVFPSLGCALWAEFGDLSNDGRLDVVVGAGECGNQNRVYHANAGVPVDDRAPEITHHEAPAAVAIGATQALRFAVKDRFVTDSGPSLDGAFAVLFPGTANDTVEAVFMGGDLFHVELPAQAEDVTVTLQLCAQDRDGNLGCTEELTYDVGAGGEPPGGSTGGGSTSGADDTAGSLTSGATVTADGTAGGPGGGTEGSSGTDAGAADDGGGGGCGCQSSMPPTGWGAGLLVVTLLGLRRRRRD
jgi:MYXO-CTERM domain-containing protein